MPAMPTSMMMKMADDRNARDPRAAFNAMVRGISDEAHAGCGITGRIII